MNRPYGLEKVLLPVVSQQSITSNHNHKTTRHGHKDQEPKVFFKKHTPSILVGFSKDLSYNTHVSSKLSQEPFLAYLAHTSQQFSSLNTKSILKEGINQISKGTK